MTAQLKSHSIGNTLVLTLSDPEHRNALGPGIYSAGIEALNAADANKEIGSVIITGEGEHFCAGGNLNRLNANRQQPPLSQTQAQSIDALHNWMESIRSFPKPVIAAVEGAAVGAGFSLSLMCDFIVASETAYFAASYANVGLSPDAGASWSLTRLLPRQLATRWLMLGERIQASELSTFGLIHSITPAGSALTKALALSEELNARAGNVLSSVKELINTSYGQDLNEHMQQEREHFVRNLHHPNAGIGIESFLSKKIPQYKPD